MKTAYASIVGLLLSINAYAQSSTIAPKHFLWEISGKNLSEKSYLFGSCQFNRADLFHLTDSLFFALNSCQSFAGEVDYSKIDSFMINWTGELGEGQQAEADSTSSGNPFLEGLSIDGGPTLLDNYLYQAASNLGLKIKGLEPLDAVKDFNDDAWQEAGGHSVKERFNRVIEKFLAGDSLDMVRYFEGEGSYWQKVLEVKRRNGVQAKSFIKSARSGSTFGVLGIGHLIGRGGVLELLKKRGYQVRRVGDGKKSDKIQAAYRLPTDEPWYTLEDAELGINLRSNADVSLKTDRNFHKGHYSIASNQGLIFFSGFLPKYGALEVDLVQLFKESFFEESTAFTLDSSRVENGVSIHFASGVANKMPFRAQLVEGSRILVFQWVFGFAERSLLSSSVDRYFKGLTLASFPMSNWKMQHSALGGFNYLFPEGIPFAKNTGKMKEYEERGEISVFYTSYKDSTFGDEYLIRYSDLPSGITYTDTYQSNSIIIRNFAGTYQADVQDFQYHPHGGYLGASATLIDSFDNAFFVQTLIRGAELFLQLQKSPTQTRNTDFFAALELSSPVPESFTTMTYKDAGFQMKATAKHYESRTEEEGELTESYEFNVANTGISTAVNFLKLGAYDELNWHDTLIRIDNLAEELSFDSLISFETYKYGNICPAYLLRYQQDTAMLQGRKIGIFCNDHLISLDISAPIPVAYTAIVDSLIQSIQLDINENSFASM
nr:TraB/GumN family protein [Saprospiraceae bacterium]